MTTTRETLVGRMEPTDKPDAREATRRWFLIAMAAITSLPAGHAAHLAGVYIGNNI